ncbi:MAG: DUF4270 domain-containing protein [Bacteroidaceae bacterium]|nr:DUF4270 domain-containing protein [Bacteroidaceae bacterium]
MKFKLAYIAVLATAIHFAACDEDSGSMGIVTNNDAITSTTSTFQIYSSTQTLDSVVASTTKSYIGQVYDPETQAMVRAEFMAQFHTFEDYVLPDEATIVKNAAGEVEADSAEVRLYFTDYFGDGNNPAKIYVYELDKDNVLREDETYFATDPLEQFLPSDAQPLAQKVFTPKDYSLTDAERTSTSHYDNVRIRLPKEWGTKLLRTALARPEYFKDSWQFIHNVLPGFYFKLQSGMGTMLTLDVSALNIYFRYVVDDSTYVGISRFSATPEVIQSSSFQNEGLESLLNAGPQPFTYIKTPAALITELTLPIDQIYAGHETDSITRARIILSRYNSTTQSAYAMGTPSNLLLLPKADLYSFFKNHKVADGISSYTTSFASSYNTYTYENVSRLIAAIHRTKVQKMRSEGLSDAQYEARYPDWNKVVVVPVVVATYTDQLTSVTRQTSVSHDFSLSSIRLKGGTEPIDMQVVYSSYH